MHYQYRWTQYHGPEWYQLVEEGWMTDIVEELAGGARLARMIRKVY